MAYDNVKSYYNAGFIGYIPSIEDKSMDESWQEYLENTKEKFEA